MFFLFSAVRGREEARMFSQQGLSYLFICFLTTLALAGCGTPSLDMSGERIEPAGPDGGVVIGSILVQADQEPPDSWVNSVAQSSCAVGAPSSLTTPRRSRQ